MNLTQITYAPVLPVWVIGLVFCLGLAALSALYRWNLERLGRNRALVLSLLRMGAIVFILAFSLNPSLVVKKDHQIPAAVAVLLDTSPSMGQEEPGTQASRLDAAKSILLKGGNPLLEGLKKRFQVNVYELSDSIRALMDDELAGLVTGAGKANLTDALQSLGANNSVVVLLSDGNLEWQPAQLKTLPAITVPIGDPTAYKDLTIRAVKAPPIAFRGREVVVDVSVKSHGYADLTLPVLMKDAGRLLTAKNIHVDLPSSEVTTSLSFVPDNVGRKNISVSVPHQVGESIVNNNQTTLSLKVVRDKIRILMVSGTPSMNYRFLRMAFKSDPSIDLLSFVILRTPSDILNVPTNEQSLIPFPVETLFTKELPNFDLVIFDNFNYSIYLRPEYLESLRNFVKEGGGFAMFGGPNLFNEGRVALSPIGDILPALFAEEKFYRRDAPIRIRLARAGATHPLLQIGDIFDNGDYDPRKFWQEMPPLDGINLMDAKGSAAVLIESADGIPWPILTVSQHGKGRVMILGTDYAWKWYMGMVASGKGNQFYLRLVSRMLRWLTRDPDLDPVQIVLPETVASAGREMVLQVKYTGDAASRATDVALSFSVFDPSGAKIASTLKPGPVAGEQLVAFVPETAGVYHIRIETPFGPQEESIVIPDPQAHLDAAPNHERLKAIALATGGVYMPRKNDLSEAIDGFARRAESRFVEEKQEPMWATPAMMAVVLGLLSLEWYLRRRWGLI